MKEKRPRLFIEELEQNGSSYSQIHRDTPIRLGEEIQWEARILQCTAPPGEDPMGITTEAVENANDIAPKPNPPSKTDKSKHEAEKKYKEKKQTSSRGSDLPPHELAPTPPDRDIDRAGLSGGV